MPVIEATEILESLAEDVLGLGWAKAVAEPFVAVIIVLLVQVQMAESIKVFQRGEPAIVEGMSPKARCNIIGGLVGLVWESKVL